MYISNTGEFAVNSRRKEIAELLEKVMNELSPDKTMKKVFNRDISIYSKVYVMGFGKAAYNMYSGIRDSILKKLAYAGIIIPQDEIHDNGYPELEILKGTHPFISDVSVNSSNKMLSNFKNLNENDLVIVLISGGGSSLFEIPVSGINAGEIMNISREIMNNGGDIYELNHIRSALSMVKNGGLAEMLYPAKIDAYAVSDVIFNDPDIIASGPLSFPVHSPKMMEYIEKYIKTPEMKVLVKTHINFIDPDKKYFKNISYNIILKNQNFVDNIYNNIDDEKVNIGTDINGDVNDVASNIVNIIRTIYKIKNHGFWFVAGGEPTVNVTGHGLGGRNEELVLKMMKLMDNNECYTFASIGTDGIDGTSPAAGGIVDNDTGIENLDEYLKNNDSYHALLNAHGLIMTGRTGNNVSDIIIGYYSTEKGNN